MGTNRIYNVEKLKRPVVFDGLPFIGTCSPTDIDFFIEVGDQRRMIIGDFKEHGKDLRRAQRILFERMVDAWSDYGYRSVAFLAWHPEDAEVIYAATTILAESYTNGEWHRYNGTSFLVTSYCNWFGVQEA